MTIEIVDRPVKVGHGNSKYEAYYAAVLDTVTTHRAIRVDLSMPYVVNAAYEHFKRKHPTLRMVVRRLPDGLYLWAELRNTNGAVEG